MFYICLQSSVQFSSVAQSYPTLWDPSNRSTPGLPVHHQLLEFTQTQVHQVGDAIQPTHPLSSPSPPASNPSQHQGLFQLNKIKLLQVTDALKEKGSLNLEEQNIKKQTIFKPKSHASYNHPYRFIHFHEFNSWFCFPASVGPPTPVCYRLEFLDSLIQELKLIKGQMRNSGKALLGRILQQEGAKTKDSCPCLLPEWEASWQESWAGSHSVRLLWQLSLPHLLAELRQLLYLSERLSSIMSL